ncbi:MAG: hypothetical protein B7Z03_04500 [Hydrogenophilales bacterium 32-62-9]|nr:MAG: hypothetical protein B7Z03_04500 [Hydrogenophilales bacterium 32-62-9]
MNLAVPSLDLNVAPAWQARLALDFQRRDAATILARREHFGPLRVQKALYPEGEGVCHVIVLHPPSGIAGGDDLHIGVKVDAGAHALLTTPGAGKWYRSAGPWAKQRLDFAVGADATLEWLPQENIVFDAARADMQSRIELDAAARFIGMDVLCLGRRASGETFAHGALQLDTRVQRGGQPIWLERGRLDAAGRRAAHRTRIARRLPGGAAAGKRCAVWHYAAARSAGGALSGACVGSRAALVFCFVAAAASRADRARRADAAHLEHLRQTRWN